MSKFLDEQGLAKVAEKINGIQDTVGDSESGLVKDVADLETIVGDSESGLVKDVADLKPKTVMLLYDEDFTSSTTEITSAGIDKLNTLKIGDTLTYSGPGSSLTDAFKGVISAFRTNPGYPESTISYIAVSDKIMYVTFAATGTHKGELREMTEISKPGTKLYKHTLVDSNSKTIIIISSVSNAYTQTGSSFPLVDITYNTISAYYNYSGKRAIIGATYRGTTDIPVFYCNDSAIASFDFNTANYTDTVTPL